MFETVTSITWFLLSDLSPPVLPMSSHSVGLSVTRTCKLGPLSRPLLLWYLSESSSDLLRIVSHSVSPNSDLKKIKLFYSDGIAQGLGISGGLVWLEREVNLGRNEY